MRLESGTSLQQEVGWDRQTLRMARYLADSQSEPFLVSSLSNIVEQLSVWNELFPSIQPTYNVGANSTSDVLRCIDSLGIPFNVNTKQELNSLVELGLSQQKTTFSNSIKLGSHIRAAKSYGINTMYCDSVEELTKIKKFHGSSRVLLQIRCSESKSVSQLGDDFGTDIANLPNLLTEAKSLGIEVEGIALSLRVVNNDYEDSFHHIRNALKIGERAVKLGKEHGHVFSVLHLGQLCVGTVNFGSSLVSGIKHAADSPMFADLRLTADATHFLVSSSVTLATKIIAVRERKQLNCMQYYIKEGVFGAFATNLTSDDCLLSAPLPLGGGRNRKGLTAKLLDSNIVGPSGDELDMVLDDIVLPRMEEGDWLLFPNMGTMNFTEYNAETRITENLCIYLKKRQDTTGMKVCPGLLQAWQTGNMRTIDLDMHEEMVEFSGGACLKGEIDLGKTFIYSK